jgi:FkbM family methyltransferase
MCNNGKIARAKRDIPFYRIIDYALRTGLRALPSWGWPEKVALWWGFKFKPAPCVVRLRSGALIFVDPADYLQLLVYYLGTFEPHYKLYLRACAGDGATIIDVGANIGVHTVESAGLVGPAGCVLSIEPAPSNVQALKRNVALNQLTNVTVIEVAVGDSVHTATLSLARGGNQGMFTLAPMESEISYDVEVRRIDDLLEERSITSVDLIKMDIEGSEFRALRGALVTLQRWRPTLMIELNEKALRNCGSSVSEIKEFLGNLDYCGWVFGRSALWPIASSHAINECSECLFIHRDRAPLIQRLGLSLYE